MNLRKLLFIPLASLLFLPLQGAIDEMPTVADSTMTYELDEVRVLTRRPLLRQAGLLMSTPGAMSLVTPTMLREYDIKHLSDLTAVLPRRSTCVVSARVVAGSPPLSLSMAYPYSIIRSIVTSSASSLSR